MSDAELARRAALIVTKISDPVEAYIQMLCDAKSNCYRLTGRLKDRMQDAIWLARQSATA